MTPERWAQVDRIHHAALERAGAERVAYLDAACAGDADLRREVESLLAYATAAEGFLERPAMQEAARAFDSDRDARAGVLPVVAGYTVLELLGAGGMGVVYLAEEDPPLRRRVALKLIRPGHDSLSVLARFEAERQALALMDHPNIAAVFGTGGSADGRPFVAMEFVEGVPITAYCDHARLSIRARLDLFVRVCAAVQHAHQKGIIHRDLKPSNVLVTEQDGRPVPKVIDFGTAAWADRARAARRGLTDAGTVLGTLEYMSPEQAAASPDVDTTTDVYSLGVLLYELLVGAVPFDRERLRAAGYEEMRRIILESDPPRPSTQLTRGRSSTSEAADARGTDVGRLTRQLSGDLDWIVLQALEKDRRRRYPTVAALTADIGRFLTDEPVEARPPSAAYRLGKFARRHRGAVSAAAAVVLVLIAGLVTSTRLYVLAERARAEADRQRDDANQQRAIAATERGAAERAATEATDGRNAAVAANAESDRLRVQAVRQVDNVNAALRDAKYRTHVANIGVADGDLRSNQPGAARERLLMVPVAQRDWEWRHLFLKTDSSLLQLGAAPCDSRVTNLPLPPRELTDALVLSDGGSRLSWTRCNVLDQWDTATFGHTLRTADPGTRFLGANESGLMLILSKRAPAGWDLQLTGERAGLPALTFGPFATEPACASISPDGTRVAIGLEPPNANGENLEDVFEIWSAEAGRPVIRLLPPRPRLPDTRLLNSSCMIQFSPDGSKVATSGGTVHVWAIESGTELRSDGDQAGRQAQPVAFSPDGSRLAVGRVSGLVDVLDLASAGPRVTRLDGNGMIEPLPLPDGLRRALLGNRQLDAVSSIAFSPDATRIVSAFNTKVAVWDVALGRLVKVLGGHPRRIISVLVGANGRFIFSADEGGNLRIWPAEASGGITRVAGSVGHSTGFALRPDGRAVAVAGLDASLAVVHLDDLSQVIVRPGAGKEDMRTAAKSLVFTPDGRYVLAGEDGPDGAASAVRRWAIATNESLVMRKADKPEPPCADARQRPRFDYRLAVSSDGRYLAVRDGLCVVVRDLAAMTTLATLDLRIAGENQLEIEAIQFRPDGALVVGSKHLQAAPPRRVVRIWDWRAGRVIRTADRTSWPSTTTSWNLAISADGSHMAMVDGIVSIWDGDLRHEIGRLPATNIEFAAFSADGRRIATVNMLESVVRVWDTATLQAVLTLTDVESHRYGVAFTADGRLVAGRSSGGFTIWESHKPPCDVCEATELRLRTELQALETDACTEGEQERPSQSQRVFVLNPRRTCWTPWLVVGGIGGIDYQHTALVRIQIVLRDGTVSEGVVRPGQGLPWSGKPVQKVRYMSLGKGPVTITFTVQ